MGKLNHEDISTEIQVLQLQAKHIDGIDIERSVIRHYLEQLSESSDVSVIDKRYKFDVYDFYFSTIKHSRSRT